MQAIFNFLYSVHPWLPAIYGVVISLGVLLPPIYLALRKKTFSIFAIYVDAKKGDILAKTVMGIYYVFFAFTIFSVVGVIIF